MQPIGLFGWESPTTNNATDNGISGHVLKKNLCIGLKPTYQKIY